MRWVGSKLNWQIHSAEIIQDPTITIHPEPMQPPTTATTNSPISSSHDRLVSFCEAIRDYEGRPGDLNYQLNNPGDCRCSPVGYLPKYGLVRCIDTNTNPAYLFHKGKFAMFPTYELGWEYLLNMVHVMAANHSSWSIVDFFAHYSPTSDGNAPNKYAEWVADRLGVSTATTLSQLLG